MARWLSWAFRQDKAEAKPADQQLSVAFDPAPGRVGVRVFGIFVGSEIDCPSPRGAAAGRARAAMARRQDYDPVAQERPAEFTRGRYEEKKADRVGYEAWHEKQYPGQEYHASMDEFLCRHVPFIQDPPDAFYDAEALHAQKNRAEQRGGEDQDQSGQNADLAADKNENRNFQDGDRKQQQRN